MFRRTLVIGVLMLLLSAFALVVPALAETPGPSLPELPNTCVKIAQTAQNDKATTLHVTATTVNDADSPETVLDQFTYDVAPNGTYAQSYFKTIDTTAPFHLAAHHVVVEDPPTSGSWTVTTSISLADQSNCATAASVCDISLDGHVVGNLPFETRAYYAPGKITVPPVIVNAGNYWVLDRVADDTGQEYYEIVIACAKLYVPVETMTPSYDGPWNGEPLPALSKSTSS